MQIRHMYPIDTVSFKDEEFNYTFIVKSKHARSKYITKLVAVVADST